MYLVIGCGSLDDVPLRLFPVKDAAEKYARHVTEEQISVTCARVLGRDMSEFDNVQVVPFDATGYPLESYMVKEAEE